MNHNIYIHVSQKHIDTGERLSCLRCPVLLAINDCLKPEYQARMGRKRTLELCLHDQWGRDICQYVTRIPNDVLCFMVNFDDGKPVASFTFQLKQIPDRMIRSL